MKKLYILMLLPLAVFSQTYYTIGEVVEHGGNVCELVNLENCARTVIPLCLNFGYSYDIAVDGSGNLYYMSTSMTTNTLMRQNQGQTTCDEIGTFTAFSINALVADSNNNLYIAGSPTIGGGLQRGRLYKYSAETGITDLGLLPPQTCSRGDLFFFENRLFLVAQHIVTQDVFLLEVNISHPDQSTYYMSLSDGFDDSFFGAFSTFSQGVSKCYLVTAGGGALFELDIPQQTVTPAGCLFPGRYVNGAASFYELSNPLAVVSHASTNLYFKVTNPASHVMVIDTNIDHEAIHSLTLFDMSGRKAKEFLFQGNTTFSIGDLKSGIYLIQLNLKEGDAYRQKVLIQN